MPVEHYYKGHGKEVMSKMKKKYGEEKGESVFYATANSRGLGKPSDSKSKHKTKKKTMFSKGK